MKAEFLRDLALLLLRLAGFSIAFAHGWVKVFALATGGGDRFVAGVAELGFPLPELFAWAAALAELAGGLLVGLGLWTRVSAAFAAFTMLVAAFLRHRLLHRVLAFSRLIEASDDTLARWGSGEMAFLYMVIFLALVLLGGGRYSLSRLLRKPRRVFG